MATSLNRSSAASTGAPTSKQTAISMEIKERRSMAGWFADNHHAAAKAHLNLLC
jgi:hypothetical protein